MEETERKKRNYRREVEAYLKRRNIQEVRDTLVWLRDQKMQSCRVKTLALENVKISIGVLDEMIAETEEEGQ